MWKKFTTFCVAFLLLFSLAACKGETITPDTKKLTKVSVGEVAHTIFYAPFYVALTEGIFKDNGLDVEYQTIPGGDKTMAALLSNGIDIALVGSETSVYVFNQGAKDPVVNFAQLTQTDGTFLVSRKKVEAFQWSDLKGTTFLGQRVGGMPQMVGEYTLKKYGINPQKDMELIQNIDFANIANAFVTGTADYVQLFEPTASLFEQEGKGYIVASFGKESGKVPYTSFMTKESYLKEDKATVEKFTKAIYEGQKWVDSHSASDIAQSIQPFFKETELEIITKVVERYKSQNSFATTPILDEEEWNNLLSIMKEAKVISADVPYEKLVNTNFAEKVSQ